MEYKRGADVYGKYERSLFGKIWASKQEATMWKTLSQDRIADMLMKVAIPHVFHGFSEVPPAFQGWDLNTTVDFHGEFWPDKELASKIMSSFTHGVAVAIPKGGQHYAMLFPNTMQSPAMITPIDTADAREMVSFPEDWEKYVYVIQSNT